MLPTYGNQRSLVPPVQSDQYNSDFTRARTLFFKPIPFSIHVAQTGVRADLLESLAAHESVRVSRPAKLHSVS